LRRRGRSDVKCRRKLRRS